MDEGALDDAVEARRGLRLLDLVHHQAVEVVVDVLLQRLAEFWDVHPASAEHPARVAVLGQRVEEVFERGELVPRLGRERDGAMNGLFEGFGKRGHDVSLGRDAGRHSFSIVHWRGCSLRRASSITWATFVSATS